MDNSTITSLLQLVEPLAAVSITHLLPATRRTLAAGELSVTAYPNEYGGFVYVGAPRFNVPAEAELAALFEIAGRAGIVWLKFDSDAGVVDGLPVFDAAEGG